MTLDKTKPQMTDEELRRIDVYWRTANHLDDNPLTPFGLRISNRIHQAPKRDSGDAHIKQEMRDLRPDQGRYIDEVGQEVPEIGPN